RSPDTNVAEQHVNDAIEEAKELLRPLTAPALSWSIIHLNDPNWKDPGAYRDPRDEFYTAVGFIDALLNPRVGEEKEKGYAQAVADKAAADNFLGGYAPLVREILLPALWQGIPRPQRTSGQHPGSFLLRDRWIAAVVATICRQYEFNPTRN